METDSVINHKIKNQGCIICGAAFKVPRAGKLYCSTACKQFRHYHRQEINDLKKPLKGISDEYFEVKLREFNLYSTMQKKVSEYNILTRRKGSAYYTFDSSDEKRLLELENELPDFVKNSKVGTLSLEEWSFVKLLYPHLKKEDFLKLINHLGRQFFLRLMYDENHKDSNSKSDPIKNLYRNHLFKIAEGKIKFI